MLQICLILVSLVFVVADDVFLVGVHNQWSKDGLMLIDPSDSAAPIVGEFSSKIVGLAYDSLYERMIATSLGMMYEVEICSGKKVDMIHFFDNNSLDEDVRRIAVASNGDVYAVTAVKVDLDTGLFTRDMRFPLTDRIVRIDKSTAALEQVFKFGSGAVRDLAINPKDETKIWIIDSENFLSSINIGKVEIQTHAKLAGDAGAYGGLAFNSSGALHVVATSGDVYLLPSMLGDVVYDYHAHEALTPTKIITGQRNQPTMLLGATAVPRERVRCARQSGSLVPIVAGALICICATLGVAFIAFGIHRSQERRRFFT